MLDHLSLISFKLLQLYIIAFVILIAIQPFGCKFLR